MARASKQNEDHDTGEGGGITGEYSRPDAAAAKRIFDTEIKPKNAHLATIRGDLSDPHKRIKDDCHFPRSVLNFITSLDDMEEAKRDHHLLALSAGLKEWGLFVPRDLVTMASGDDGANVVPSGKRPRPRLATVPSHPTDDSDLADGAE